MKNLEWIQLWSSGFDHILEMNFPARKVRVTNAQGVFDVPIAEWCVSMMINLTRDLRGMIQNQEQGIWDRDARFQRELRGLTVGFWGYGGLARETARLCKTLGLKIHVLSRGEIKCRPKSYVVPGTGDPDGILPDILFRMEKKMEFLSGLDFLVLATPLDSTTRGMVGEAELKALPRKAYLLNPARGPLIQEPALLRALKERWFAGAALDTHFAYPMPPDHPLWQFPNVIMTPHISGSSLSPHFLTRVWDIFQQNVIHFLRNEPLLNEVSLKQLSP
ncbi:MAG: D-2-hydroxyacid dehydrogenase [Verrucomicrobiota bacterium]